MEHVTLLNQFPDNIPGHGDAALPGMPGRCYHTLRSITRRNRSMAMGKKTTLEVELHPDMVQMLEHARELYGFRSTSKALRVILDYVAVDADWEKIFMSQRCLRCGA
ncbi:MAG: hypothetical protein V1245_05670, partial [Arenicellales bacterium]|nr:hypothetical protein [Arenicellales bacterium]